jgi:8-oxo-dGTP pyrophosphatase MutT (NUDIX family)
MPDAVDLVAHRNSRPAKRMGAGALIRDRHGQVLIVEPTYQDHWEVPGGVVEADESPRAACARELSEELSADLSLGRLLVIEWQGPEPDRTESMMFLYDGGVLDGARILLAREELRSFAFVAPEDLGDHLVERLARRMRAGLLALAEDRLVEMEHGVVLASDAVQGRQE